jgi:hypothetical protein
METAPSMVKRYHPDVDDTRGLPEFLTSHGAGGTAIPSHAPDDDEVVNRLFFHKR